MAFLTVVSIAARGCVTAIFLLWRSRML